MYCMNKFSVIKFHTNCYVIIIKNNTKQISWCDVLQDFINLINVDVDVDVDEDRK